MSHVRQFDVGVVMYGKRRRRFGGVCRYMRVCGNAGDFRTLQHGLYSNVGVARPYDGGDVDAACYLTMRVAQRSMPEPRLHVGKPCHPQIVQVHRGAGRVVRGDYQVYRF